jgi:hypothetical protein
MGKVDGNFAAGTDSLSIPLRHNGRKAAVATLPRTTPQARAVRTMTVAPAVVLGVFGWLVAHTVTFWFAAHSHNGPLSLTARHLHDYSALAAIVTGCLAAVACVTAAATGIRRDHRPRRRTVHLSVGLSTGAFLVADTVEHVLLDLPHSPPALVLLGAGLHAVMGAATSLFWLTVAQAIQARVRTRHDVDLPAVPQRCRTSRTPHPWRTHLWAAAVPGRAPPVLVL